MEQKINIRLSFIALLAVVFVTAANLLVFYNLFRTQITNDLKMNARMLMETEVFQREYDSLGNDPEKLSSSTLNKLETGDVRLTWIAEDGTVLFDNDAGASGLANHLDRPEIQEAMTNGEGESIRSSQTLGMAFEHEQRFEQPDGEDIVFDMDYYGIKRGMKPVAGPFA